MADNDQASPIRSDVPATQPIAAMVEAADLVFVGKVVNVQQMQRLAPAAAHPRITEHDTPFDNVEIQVVQMIKGDPALKTVIAHSPRFPPDVAFARVPIYKSGDEGIFLLKRDQLTGEPHALLTGQKVLAYTGTSKPFASAPNVLGNDQLEAVRAAATSPATQP